MEKRDPNGELNRNRHSVLQNSLSRRETRKSTNQLSFNEFAKKTPDTNQ